MLFELSELKEAEPKEEMSVFVVRAVLRNDATTKAGKDLHVLRAGISLPGDYETVDKGRFGLPPEVIAIGLAGAGSAALGTIKIKFNREMGSFPDADKTLLAKHRGEWNPPALDEKEAHEIVKLMIQTYIAKDKN